MGVDTHIAVRSQSRSVAPGKSPHSACLQPTAHLARVWGRLTPVQAPRQTRLQRQVPGRLHLCDPMPGAGLLPARLIPARFTLQIPCDTRTRPLPALTCAPPDRDAFSKVRASRSGPEPMPNVRRACLCPTPRSGPRSGPHSGCRSGAALRGKHPGAPPGDGSRQQIMVPTDGSISPGNSLRGDAPCYET